MKKILLVFLGFVFMGQTAVYAESRTADEINTEIEKHKSAIEELEKELKKVNDEKKEEETDQTTHTFDYEDMEVEVTLSTNKKIEKGILSYTAEENETYLIATYRITNNDDESKMIDESYFRPMLLDEIYEPSILIGADYFSGEIAIPAGGTIETFTAYSMDEAVASASDLKFVQFDNNDEVIDEFMVN